MNYLNIILLYSKKIILILLTGTESVIGAKSGSVYEYYFRTSLDKYSALLGMIFAMNFPLVSLLIS